MTRADPEQQNDLALEAIEHGFALVRITEQAEAVVAGGPFAGERWPAGMLRAPARTLEGVTAPVISVAAQIEIKQMMPVWNPALQRRAKDTDDLAALRASAQH